MSSPKKTMEELVDDLRARREQVMLGGGADRLAKHKEQGKLTARERVDALTDPGSFEEFGLFAQHRQVHFGMAGKDVPADGVVTGAASVDGRLIHLASQDFTVLGGSAGEVHSQKVADVMERSLHTGTPFVFINDSGGARAGGHRLALRLRPRLPRQRQAFRAVPQISLICGPCAGGAAYSPRLTDFIIQTRRSQMFITRPQVIKQVTGEVITAEALGGPDAHMGLSGVTHFIAEDDEAVLYLCRRVLSFLPSNNLEDASGAVRE
ncbi:MAG: carboxyl transferase domain-containing protein [Singulisphaera sp.]